MLDLQCYAQGSCKICLVVQLPLVIIPKNKIKQNKNKRKKKRQQIKKPNKQTKTGEKAGSRTCIQGPLKSGKLHRELSEVRCRLIT